MPEILENFLSSPPGELITFRAFDYQLGDASVPLATRFRGRQILVLSVGTKSMKLGLVSFNAEGKASVAPSSQLLPVKTGGALTDHLKSAIRSANTKKSVAPWIVVLIAHGWTSDTVKFTFHGSDVERMQKLRECPEEVVGKPLPMDMEHVAIPHPMLEGSVCFSIRHAVLHPVLDAVKAAGLRIARVQISLAAMLEAYVRTDSDGAQARDILALDHQGAFLLQVQKKEWGKVRFRSGQPSEMTQELEKLLRDRTDPTAPLTLLGNRSEMLEKVFAQEGTPSEIVEPFDCDHPDILSAVACEKGAHILHDINPDRPAPRPPLPKFGRMLVVGYMMAAFTLTALILGNVSSALTRKSMSASLTREKDVIEKRIQDGEAEEARISKEIAYADDIGAWVRVGYHPQRFLLTILRSIPDSVVLGNVEAKMSEGLLQMDFGITLEGAQEAQAEAIRSVEQAIYAQGIRVVTREPAPAGGRSMTYRFTLILPAPGEAISFGL